MTNELSRLRLHIHQRVQERGGTEDYREARAAEIQRPASKGGLDLGLEQAGMETVWQVEFDDWARGKLEENFPHTEKFKDVREVGKHNLKPVDLICGGFPCTDVSTLNDQRSGLAGKRSGLWFEYARVVRELRPSYVLIENVPALFTAGMDRVLCDLAACGYDAEWQVIRASSVGQPTRRKRLFIVAYPVCQRLPEAQVFSRNNLQSLHQANSVWDVTTLRLNDLEYTYPTIPEHLRMDNGLSFELSEIEAAIKGYGNAVAPPVAKWIGERIMQFDAEVRAND